MARCSVLEQELSKAQKTIAKSKKATEVQLLMQEKESVQRKLAAQEDDFRMQNQTLLTELSNVRLKLLLHRGSVQFWHALGDHLAPRVIATVPRHAFHVVQLQHYQGVGNPASV